MSQEPKFSSEHQMHSSVICVSCEEIIVDHIYSVQRRRLRPLEETLPNGEIRYNPEDLLDHSHAGVILGPEYDPYCPTCFAELPTIQELINAYKKRTDKPGKNLD